MDIVDRIQKLVDKKGLSIAALERNTGLSNGIIKKWRKQNPSCDKIISIANYLNAPIEYLLLGTEGTRELTFDAQQLLNYYNQLDKMDKGIVLGKAEALAELAAERRATKRAADQPKKPREIDAPASDPLPNDEQKGSETCEITYFDYPASAGTGLFLDETTAEKLTVRATPEALSADYAIPISGDSMEPDFSSGNIVLVKSCPGVSEGEIGIFVLDGEAYIKEYGGNCLISHNQEYSPIMLKEYKAAVCLGLVLGKAEVIE